ncbi:MAG: hypothetical protein ACI4HQ_14525 [Acetatifactor sp.]
MSNYHLEGNKYVIENYDKMPPFSSFLPGLAGVKGIPVWSFYTNRGQAMSSFGIHNKGNAMMEFNPANTSYEETPIKGFRTFVRVDGEFYEPFCSYAPEINRRMEIEKNVVSITEENKGLKITVTYMVLPNESIGAIVRKVTLEITDGEPHEIELIDGMPQIITYGVQNSLYKEMSNLFRSYAEIRNMENNAPYYTTRAASDDSGEVAETEGGFFYLAVKDGELLPVICDKNVIFDFDSSLRKPVVFLEQGLKGVLERKQCAVNKIPCGFVTLRERLKYGEKIEFTAFAGFASSVELLNGKAKTLSGEGYTEEKLEEARKLADFFTKDVYTKTSSPLFDRYMEQCYLDNFLRGGYPFLLGEGEHKKVVHLFSRKHGDPERDYNFFSIAGEYYSQGNGNYRDVCQNRRNDVFFNPAIGDFNVHHFFSLVQMDGYNPLEIRPFRFVIDGDKKEAALTALSRHVEDKEGRLAAILDKPFTPGQITNLIARYQMKVTGDEELLINELISLAEEQMEACFKEGYWSDHWDYNLDLVEDYLLVYPDKEQELLFDRKDYRFYDSVGVVRPRKDTYVINKKGKVRQYGSLYESREKAARQGFDKDGTNWLKDEQGRTVTTCLFGKLLTLAVNKFALLDSHGLGIEMEGGRPGWNDAMNGLPGLFGSSMPETMELKRLVDFMCRVVPGSGTLDIPAELADFMRDIYGALQEKLSDFAYWDKVADLREKFREKIIYTVSGERAEVPYVEIRKVLEAFAEKLASAWEKALDMGQGIMPTYFTYEASEFEALLNEDGTPRISPYGLPGARVKAFEPVKVPFFLEGPARMLAACGEKDRSVAEKMCEAIKKSDIYDRELKMYKTSESIENMSAENGRVRAFTAGWLERESIFLHMEYKYFLGMLKAGLYKEFYEAISDALIPYQKPEVYGRSILENSSFLASGANPDPAVHGQGFVARLSGSTVEMLSMWIGMFLGEGGFRTGKDGLQLVLAPRLSGEMFDGNGEAAFMLCGSCTVTYHNEKRRDTYGADSARVIRMELTHGTERYTVEGDTIPESLAQRIREGRMQTVDAYLA